MREIDLSKYQIRTDLVVDLIEKDSKLETKYKYKNITVSNIKLDKENSNLLKRKEGLYTTIHFEDITDKTNYKDVLKVMVEELTKIINESGIKEKDSCMIIGLGNEKSTADELGVTTAKKVTVTKHIYDLTGTL